jgi:hypothetical protein
LQHNEGKQEAQYIKLPHTNMTGGKFVHSKSEEKTANNTTGASIKAIQPTSHPSQLEASAITVL